MIAAIIAINVAALSIIGYVVFSDSVKKTARQAPKEKVVSTNEQIQDSGDKEKASETMPSINNSTNQLIADSIYINPKTERDIRWKQNHSNLIKIQNEVLLKRSRASLNEEEISIEDVRKWARFLYKDALLALILDENSEDSNVVQYKKEFDELDSTPKSELTNVKEIPTTSKYYRPSLSKLIYDAYDNEDLETNSHMRLTAASNAGDLAGRRKRYSDSMYMAESRSIYENMSISIVEKIEYAEIYLQAGDWRLIEFSMSFFETLLEHGDEIEGFEATEEELQKMIDFQNRSEERQNAWVSEFYPEL